MKNKSLYNELIEYSKTDMYPLHMPGHKRQGKMLEGLDPYDIDITEIEGFDNLHNPQGIIKESMDFAKDYFGTRKTWFLVNGSTCGILSAIFGTTKKLDTVLVAKNCHRAVFNAIKIRDLNAVYIEPEVIDGYGIYGGLDPEKIDKILEREDIRAVIITSPTYEGMVCDVEKIADIVHKHNAVLIVDEAHGAHFGVGDMPKAAYMLGADIVIESSHKTLEALTQTAFLHIGKDSKNVNEEKIQEYLGIFQSSSPSYILMASMDKCVRKLAENGDVKVQKLLSYVNNFRKNVNNFSNFKILDDEIVNKNGVFALDKAKIPIFINNFVKINDSMFTGLKMEEILRNKGFEVEMSDKNFVLAIFTMSDDYSKLDEFYNILEFVDKKLSAEGSVVNVECNGDNNDIKEADVYKYRISQVEDLEKESVEIVNSIGRVSADFVFKYPPGIPILIPGQMITKSIATKISDGIRNELNIIGLDNSKIKCVK